MYKITLTISILLILLGAGGYFFTGSQSITALIPAFFGLLIAVLALTTKDTRFNKHAMHVIMILALLGFLGSISGLPKLFTLISGNEVLRPAAAISQSIMTLLCAVLLGFGIKSFINARRKSK